MSGHQPDLCKTCQHVSGDHIVGGGWLDPVGGRCRRPDCDCTEFRSAGAWLDETRSKLDAHEQAAFEQQERLC